MPEPEPEKSNFGSTAGTSMKIGTSTETTYEPDGYEDKEVCGEFASKLRRNDDDDDQDEEKAESEAQDRDEDDPSLD